MRSACESTWTLHYLHPDRRQKPLRRFIGCQHVYHDVWSSGQALLNISAASLEYCGQFWSPYYKEDIAALEKVQRGAIRPIPGVRGMSYKGRLKELNLFRLSQLRLRGDLTDLLSVFETSSETIPQMILMLYIFLRSNKGLKSNWTTDSKAISWAVVNYHMSLRASLTEKKQLKVRPFCPWLVYFGWNLLLLASRIVAVTLLTLVSFCYIGFNFLCVWAAFLLWTWKQNTKLIGRPKSEWLYRAMAALILYFNWFNVAEGRTLGKCIIYHSFIFVDTLTLLVVWYIFRDTHKTDAYAMHALIGVPVVYLSGVLCRGLYYWRFHPKVWTEKQNNAQKGNEKLQNLESPFDEIHWLGRWLLSCAKT
uniref:XK-related protein n=1 Tax=Erpetoichthys calabaricus TaxID=27687 RepID=A0A8C4XE19_ERPCA